MIVARYLSINAIKAGQFRLFALGLACEGVPICRRPLAEAFPYLILDARGVSFAAVAAPLSAASAAPQSGPSSQGAAAPTRGKPRRAGGGGVEIGGKLRLSRRVARNYGLPPPGGDRTSAYSGKTGVRGRGGRKLGDRLRNRANFAGRPRRTLSHEPCIPLFQQVCVTPRTSPVTPPWKVGGVCW
jgi:hypothetical protein